MIMVVALEEFYLQLISLSPLRISVEVSVAAALLHHHVLVVPQDHVVVLIVQHGERGEARGHAGRAGHALGLVEPQEALGEDQRVSNMNNMRLWERTNMSAT